MRPPRDAPPPRPPPAELQPHPPPPPAAPPPAHPRARPRLLVVSRRDPGARRHLRVRDLPTLLEAGDALVYNTTSVLPARLFARRPSGGKVEGLFLRQRHDVAPPAGSAAVWETLLKTNRKPKAGERLTTDAGVALRILERDSATGEWLVAVEGADASPDPGVTLDAIGATPLPPYILAARKARHDETPDEADRRWYQTVFSDPGSTDSQGASVAAPTAGLHFTPELLVAIDAARIARASVVLHVGAGTFKPIETDTVEAHPMHAERCLVPGRTLRTLDDAHAARGRRIAVGTTTARALESVPDGHDGDWAGETRLLITPGYAWKRVDALMTNFHLPRSTLLAMVGALFPGGVADLLDVYREAIEREYRFYSYGDAMLILP
ncbi:MAG: tRNA preQ1(34) S-adenosylmethionine ribosyltransferase-isomerase QueA [Phycisphaerales bacterium]